jgi:biotin synthase
LPLCGLRKGNGFLERYRMPLEEIVKHAVTLDKDGYGTIVLQSGEDAGYTVDNIADIIIA